ncbi:uncharacterized protein ACNS7B_012965 [Menidia menidia]
MMLCLCCQVCGASYEKMFAFRNHMDSFEHQQKMKNIFPEASPSRSRFIPNIVFVEPKFRHEILKNTKGPDLITFCFSSARLEGFYLCHICEQRCPSDSILDHIFSQDHWSNYICYTNPNELSFSWIPNMNMRGILGENLKKGNDKSFLSLQVLNLPLNLVEKFHIKTYSEVMFSLCENEHLLKLFEAIQPKRTTIETYQNDSSRMHPLLGLQHVVECVCAEQRHYLCTLCRRTVASHMIIRHLLSFDHIYCYFKVWHPSTLMSRESYTDHDSFAPLIADLARQEEIHGTTNALMKRVSLKPDKYKAVDFTCFAAALGKLESITNSSLTVDFEPGNKLEHRAAVAQLRSAELEFRCRVHCQHCSDTFDSMATYFRHLSTWKHENMLWEIFDGAGRGDGFRQRMEVYVGLDEYASESLRRNQPAVGTGLVVTCISTEAEAGTFYLCFACRESFLHSVPHMDSRNHLINTLMYQNPWRLPFGWEQDLDDDALRSMAWEEDLERRQEQIVLKLFDMPFSIFWSLDWCDYKQVMAKLQPYQTVLMSGVPESETLINVQQNGQFPLLGRQFIVNHDLIMNRVQQVLSVGSLCLLCERRLSDPEAKAHVFSREHVSTFLERFHPGSLDSGSVGAEVLLDLAKQAASLHTPSQEQEIKLKRPIWDPCHYQTATRMLASAKRKERKGKLKPPITPKRKLIPTSTPREVDQNPEKDIQENSSHTNEQEREKEKETLTESRKELETKQKDSPKMGSADLKTAGEVDQSEAKTEKFKEGKPSSEVAKSCRSTDQSEDKQSEAKENSGTKRVPTPLDEVPKANERKKPRSLFEMSQRDRPSEEDEEIKTSPKRRQLVSSCEEAPNREESKTNATTKAIHTLEDLHLRPDNVEKPPLPPPQPCVKEPLKASAAPHAHLSSVKEKGIKKSEGPEDGAPHIPSVTKAVHKPAPAFSKSNKDPSKTHITVPRTVGSSKPCVIDPEGSKDALMLNVSKCEAKTGSFCKADACPSTMAESLKTETTSEIKEKPVISSICSASPSQSAAASSKMNQKAFAPKAAVSRTTSAAEPVTICKPPARGSAAPSLIKPTSCTAAPKSQTANSVVHEAGCRPAASSVANHAPRRVEAETKTSVAPQTETPFRVSAKMSKTSATTKVSEAPFKRNAVEARADDAPNAPKKNQPAAPPLSTAGFMKSDHKNLQDNPPLVSENKRQSGNPPKVGSYFLTVVSCEEKQQIYCELCCLRLTSSTSHHLISFNHQYKYVKLKYPQWTAKQSELSSKLKNTVNLLALVEQNLPHSRTIKKEKVSKEVYQKLGNLPGAEAVEMVKSIQRQRHPADGGDAFRREVTSPCEVSSSDDGLLVPHVERAALSAKNQIEATNKSQNQKQVKIPVMESELKRKATLGESPPVQSSDCEKDPSEQQLPSSASGENHQMGPVPAPSSQTEDVPETIKREQTDPDAETCSEATLWIQSAAVKKEKTPGCTQPWERDPASQNPAKAPESAQISSPVQIRSAGLQAARVDRGQQNQPGPSHKAEQPGEHSGSQTLTRASVGRKALGCSHLSFYLKASQQDMKSVIGMGSVWECRGNSLKTFFLCESCEEILLQREICQHMVSTDHQLGYMWKTQPEFLQMYWFKDDLLPGMKMSILKDAVQKLSERERLNKVDAQCILLDQDLHEFIRTAPFSEALKTLKYIKDEEQPSVFHLSPIIATQEKAVNEPETSDSSGPAFFGGPDVIEARRIPLDGTFSISKADAVISPVPGVGTHLDPPETRSCSALQAQVQPALCRPDPLLQVKQEEEESELTNIVPVSGPTLGVSPQNKCPPLRKRPADVPVGTLHRALSSSSQDPLPDKWSPNKVQIKSEPISPPISEPPSVTTAGKWTFSDQLSTLKSCDSKVNLPPFSLALDSSFGEVKATAHNNAPTDLVQKIKTEAPAQIKCENQLFSTDVGSAFTSNGFSFEGCVNSLVKVKEEVSDNMTVHTTTGPSEHANSQTVAGYTSSNNAPLGAQGSPQEYILGELYPCQIYPDQTVSSFSLTSSEHNAAAGAPASGTNLPVQKYYLCWRRCEGDQ